MGSFSFKKLAGDGCTVECDLSTTVSELKDAVAEKEGIDKNLIKLISKGQILKNESPVMSIYDPTGKDILVLFISKAKKSVTPAVKTPAPATPFSDVIPNGGPVGEIGEVGEVSIETPVITAPTPVTTTVVSPPTDTVEPPAPITPPTPEEEIASNPLAQAIPLLMVWLLQSSENAEAMKVILQNDEVQTQLVNSVPLRRALLEIPAVRNQILRANPQIAAIATSQEESFNALVSNPSFMQSGMTLLQEAANSSNMGGMMGAPSAEGDDGAEEDVINTQAMSSVGLTTSEQSEVQEIVAMGFSQAEVIQIYVACDKNKEMTINFLIGGGMG